MAMKMIQAIVRQDAADDIADGLAEAGFVSMTKINAFGRGKQKGITVDSVHYDELPRVILLMVVEEANMEKALTHIKSKAYTGNFGDGKVFVLPVEDALTVRTGSKGL